MKILIAPNAFKNSLNATNVSLAIEKGLKDSGLNASLECCPIADGGDGTGELIIKKWRGETIKIIVKNPLGKAIESSFGLIDEGKTAVIEMANASGIRLLKSDALNPLVTSSFGTGELIKAALDHGVKKIILGMGGSATVDGGVGILRALGIEFLASEGTLLTNLPQDLGRLHSINLANLDSGIFDCELTILCDVDNTLLGPEGAAHVFGPQKGATPAQVLELESLLAHFNSIVHRQTGIDMTALKHSGTAGGAAAGLHALLNAKLVNGIDYFLTLVDFESSLKNSNLLITGEGCLDIQTLQGKGPMGVAKLAIQHQVPVVALAGSVSLSDLPQLRPFFNVILPISNQPMPLAEALLLTAENLSRTATELGNLLATPSLRSERESDFGSDKPD